MPNLNLICLAELILCYRYLLSNVDYSCSQSKAVWSTQYHLSAWYGFSWICIRIAATPQHTTLHMRANKWLKDHLSCGCRASLKAGWRKWIRVTARLLNWPCTIWK